MQKNGTENENENQYKFTVMISMLKNNEDVGRRVRNNFQRAFKSY
jgi:hypothetical protein